MEKLLKLIGKLADDNNLPCYVIGGYVRDKLLGIDNDDIDIVVEGDALKLADLFAKETNQGQSVVLYERYGTASVRYNDMAVEFVGARVESYSPDSRNPSVKPGTLFDDQLRRDFTINTMAVCLNSNRYGELIDPFNGQEDLKNKRIITPTDPIVTFNDDPLRMFRAIRFACKLEGFWIEPKLLEVIYNLRERINILSGSRIGMEFLKIMSSPDPVKGIRLLDKTGLLDYILPELTALKPSGIGPVNHKNNFEHSVKVLANITEKTNNPYLRIAALLHDIGKTPTQKYDPVTNEWTFHNHEYIGATMIITILNRLSIGKKDYLQNLIKMHMRPAMISTAVITDSAVRRLIFDAGENLPDLLLLCESDITSKNPKKVARLHEHYNKLREIINNFKKEEIIRLFQPCLGGDDIMRILGIHKGKVVGLIKNSMKDAILDGKVSNTPEALETFMKEKYEELVEDGYA